MPRPVMMRMRSPMAAAACASSWSHTAWLQRRAGEHEGLAAREQRVAQHRSCVHRARDLFEALGHVEVDRRRDLAQVAQRLGDALRRGLAVVDVQRAAVVQRDADVVVAAEGVVPRQPVHQHRRLVRQEGAALAQHLLVGAPHAVRVDHALGLLGRARGEQELGDRVRARLRVRGGERRRRAGVAAGRSKRRTVRPSGISPCSQHHGRVGRHGRGDRACA